MNPCAKYRQSITLLALDELGPERARALRAHLECCEGCRRYYAEILNVTGKLDTLETEQNIRASAAFHRRLLGALRKEAPRREPTLVEQLRLIFSNRPATWAAIGAVAALVAALVIFAPASHSPLPQPVIANSVPAPNASADLSPTIANYQMVADRSLDKLDDLLTRQGNRYSAPAPVYTASDFARLSLAN